MQTDDMHSANKLNNNKASYDFFGVTDKIKGAIFNIIYIQLSFIFSVVRKDPFWTNCIYRLRISLNGKCLVFRLF